MADQQPNTAPENVADRMAAGEKAQAAGDVPGGGGLGGKAAAEGHAHSGGGAAPNSPIDVPVPVDDTAGQAGAEAALRASNEEAEPDHPSVG